MHIEQFAETLRRTPGVRSDEVFVRDEPDGFARLYYGTHYRRTDPKTRKLTTPPKLREDMDFIRQLGGTAGERYFLRAMIVRMPTPNVGNPEWDLSGATGKYSLQVAAFEPTDNFGEYKQAAAEYCKLLRDKGYEAYYYHAQASSVVTVGVFGPDAVVTDPAGRTYYNEQVRGLQRDDLLKYNLLNGRIYKARDDQGQSVPVSSRLVEIPQRPASTP